MTIAPSLKSVNPFFQFDFEEWIEVGLVLGFDRKCWTKEDSMKIRRLPKNRHNTEKH